MSSLVERLRAERETQEISPCGTGFIHLGSGQFTPVNPDGPEAANEIERLREALTKIADRAAILHKGTDDWFELVEFETVAREALSIHDKTTNEGE